jgi:hypothetical protein
MLKIHRVKPCTEPEFSDLLKIPEIDSQPGGTDSLESIIGFLNRLQIRAQGWHSRHFESPRLLTEPIQF